MSLSDITTWPQALVVVVAVIAMAAVFISFIRVMSR